MIDELSKFYSRKESIDRASAEDYQLIENTRTETEPELPERVRIGCLFDAAVFEPAVRKRPRIRSSNIL